jgi:hypothetical protein
MGSFESGLQRLGQLRQAREERRGASPVRPLDHETLSSATFKKGDQVTDPVTAARGVVVGTYHVRKLAPPA